MPTLRPSVVVASCRRPSAATTHPRSQLPPHHRHQRAGLSLMETMLATAILLGSVVALSELASIGRQHSQRAARITKAQILCQNKMSEITSGISPAWAVVDEPLPSDPDWIHTIEVQPTAWDRVVSVEVSVREATENGTSVAAKSDVTLNQKAAAPAFRLVRWLCAKSISFEDEDESNSLDDQDDGFYNEDASGGSDSRNSQGSSL